MDESALLAHIAAQSAHLHGSGDVVVGPGDDCAVITFGNEELLLSVDQLIEGRHYEAGTDPALVGRKAIGRALSDIAAMGGEPVCTLASAAIAEGYGDIEELFGHMRAWAERWASPLVGGDLSSSDGPMAMSVTVVGRAHSGRGCVLRSEARAGDSVYVTCGGAGDHSCGLGGAFTTGRHLEPTPRLEVARAIADTLGADLGAMIDLSDGLGRDASRVAEASGVRMELDLAAVPLADGLGDDSDQGKLAWLGEGEDYELCFTVRTGAQGRVPSEVGGVRLARVGEVKTGAGCAFLTKTGAFDARVIGWDHKL